MKYRFEYDKDDPDTVTLHLDVDLFKFIPRKEKQWKSDDDDEEDGPYGHDGESPVFLNRLLMMKGIENAESCRYDIKITRGSIFSWRSLTKEIIADLQVSLNRGKRAQRTYHRCQIKASKKIFKEQRCQ